MRSSTIMLEELEALRNLAQVGNELSELVCKHDLGIVHWAEVDRAAHDYQESFDRYRERFFPMRPKAYPGSDL